MTTAAFENAKQGIIKIMQDYISQGGSDDDFKKLILASIADYTAPQLVPQQQTSTSSSEDIDEKLMKLFKSGHLILSSDSDGLNWRSYGGLLLRRLNPYAKLDKYLQEKLTEQAYGESDSGSGNYTENFNGNIQEVSDDFISAVMNMGTLKLSEDGYNGTNWRHTSGKFLRTYDPNSKFDQQMRQRLKDTEERAQNVLLRKERAKDDALNLDKLRLVHDYQGESWNYNGGGMRSFSESNPNDIELKRRYDEYRKKKNAADKIEQEANDRAFLETAKREGYTINYDKNMVKICIGLAH